jgi:hypothetical protein
VARATPRCSASARCVGINEPGASFPLATAASIDSAMLTAVVPLK